MIGLKAIIRPARRPSPHAGGQRAVIDIGSNSLRLVIWAGSPRDPQIVVNEKVAANLGRTLSRDGLLPKKAMETALRGLARFALLVRLARIESLRVVATAAVRDAANGAEFLDRVRALGLSPELLSGEEEAEASVLGVLSAFPRAHGIVGDLGGGSLELVQLEGGRIVRGDSFPWGTLRLPALRAPGPAAFEKAIRQALEERGWRGAGAGGNFYLVGGSWRALTILAMHDTAYPLVDPHGFVMSPAQASALNVGLIEGERRLQDVPQLPGARIASLPDAAALLDIVVRSLRPQQLVTSAFGLREGLLYAGMDEATRATDPLIAGLRAQAEAHAGDGDALASWIAPLFVDEDDGDARLRLAACLLAATVEAAGREARAQRSIELALHERRIGIGACDRAVIAAALLTEAGEKLLPTQLAALCTPERLQRGVRWGQAMRFARKLSGGVGEVLERSRLAPDERRLVLTLEPAMAALYGESAEAQHKLLAAQHGLEPRVAGIGAG